MFLGIDIGTTSICAVLIDEKGNTKLVKTLANNTGKTVDKVAKIQNPDKIFEICKGIYREIIKDYKLDAIGLSGQMHGIVYVDKNGLAVSPLYSWQDGRGNLEYKNGLTYAEELFRLTKYKMATGFGCTSLFYDTVNGKIPDTAVSFCTIGDYIAMRLTGAKQPLLHQSNAASLGLYDIKNNRFDKKAILKAKLNINLFPKTTAKVDIIGKTANGVCVYTAVGDNQASVFGVIKESNTGVINIGTGSQISVVVDKYPNKKDCEIRPFVNGKYLLTGCAICGGFSYEILRNFFRSVNGNIDYNDMNKWAEKEIDNLPVFDTRFKGTRKDPDIRASITNLTENNFTASAITLSLLKGVSKELKDFYDKFKVNAKTFVSSGNAVRNNPILKKIIEKDFGAKVFIPKQKEEAAFGVALLSAENYLNKSLKKFIKYE